MGLCDIGREPQILVSDYWCLSVPSLRVYYLGPYLYTYIKAPYSNRTELIT